jgi:hypothetical protein
MTLDRVDIDKGSGVDVHRMGLNGDNPEKPQEHQQEQHIERKEPHASLHTPSFGDYLCAQLTSKQLDGPQHTKHERVYNFLHVPQNLEKVLMRDIPNGS